jgi:hypothetical protein
MIEVLMTHDIYLNLNPAHKWEIKVEIILKIYLRSLYHFDSRIELPQM